MDHAIETDYQLKCGRAIAKNRSWNVLRKSGPWVRDAAPFSILALRIALAFKVSMRWSYTGIIAKNHCEKVVCGPMGAADDWIVVGAMTLRPALGLRTPGRFLEPTEGLRKSVVTSPSRGCVRAFCWL